MRRGWTPAQMPPVATSQPHHRCLPAWIVRTAGKKMSCNRQAIVRRADRHGHDGEDIGRRRGESICQTPFFFGTVAPASSHATQIVGMGSFNVEDTVADHPGCCTVERILLKNAREQIGFGMALVL